MTNEELNTELYKKLFSEQEAYKEWLTKQPSEEILNHAYEYIMREDIIMAMEYLDLNDKQAKALINAFATLDEIFHDFVKIEDDHMDTVRECIKNRANKNIEAQHEALRSLPVYIFSADYAKEHGELETYRASHRANVDCKNAIEEAISNNYKDNQFNSSCVNDVIDNFGMERVAFVLACTVQNKNWDRRISTDNKAWAKDVFGLSEYDVQSGRHTHEYACSQAHTGLINLFINHFRKEQAIAAVKKPSVLDKLNKAKDDLPKKPPSKAKEVER